MGIPDPRIPVRGDHRFIRKMISLNLPGKVLEKPSEFSRISRVFSKAGGSWVRIYQGSPQDIELLKRILKMAYKKGYLTKKEPWTGKYEG